MFNRYGWKYSNILCFLFVTVTLLYICHHRNLTLVKWGTQVIREEMESQFTREYSEDLNFS